LIDARENQPATAAAPVAGSGAVVERARGGLARSAVARAAGAGGGSRGAGGAAGAPLPEIKLIPGVKRDTVYINPAQQNVALNAPFSTGLEFYNPEEARVDRIDLWVQYDPASIELKWIDPDPIGGRVAGGLKPVAWPEQGLVRIAADLQVPLTGAIEPLCELHWQAIGPTPATRIRLQAPGDAQLRMMDGDRNMLVDLGIADRTRLNAVVRVLDPVFDRDPLRMAGQMMASMTDVRLDPLERVRLAIVSPQPSVAPGQVAYADIALVNPAHEPIDTLQMRIRYDPAAIKILDADADNYINKGINIFDGDFHSAFPFDYQGRNNVDPDRGVIEYEMGSASGPVVYPGGTVARIVYRVERMDGEAAFWFERADAAGRKTTDVSSLRTSLLGPDDETAIQALHGMRAPVLPMTQGTVGWSAAGLSRP
jgi:hypothetical protein